jgi:hypothetical protein
MLYQILSALNMSKVNANLENGNLVIRSLETNEIVVESSGSETVVYGEFSTSGCPIQLTDPEEPEQFWDEFLFGD